MAKKSTGPKSITDLFSITSVIPGLLGAGAQRSVRTSFRLSTEAVSILARLTKLYGLTQKQLLALTTGFVQDIQNKGDVLKNLQEVASGLTVGNAARRTRKLTADSLEVLNDLAARINAPRDAVLEAVLGFLGADPGLLTKRQRQKLQKAIEVLDDLRAHAEEAEARLMEILGPQHAISWEALTGGIESVHQELKADLHALRAGASGRSAAGPGGSVRSKAKAKAKRKPRPKPRSKVKAGPKTKAKPKPKPKTKLKAKPKAKSKSTVRGRSKRR